jgi:hypothetical protein
MSYLPTYRRDQEYTLPTDRKHYVLHHPVTRMADLHSNEKMIPPLWTKISKTAWYSDADCILSINLVDVLISRQFILGKIKPDCAVDMVSVWRYVIRWFLYLM